MLTTFAVVTGLAAVAQAFTQPKGDPTWGPLRTPDTSSQVVRGQKFNVTWDPEQRPTQGLTVSLVLCKGPGSNCQLQPDAIAENLPASQKSFSWYVPCELAPGTAKTATGYGMAVIVDQTGEYQYSTQFSIQEGDVCTVDPTKPGETVQISTYETVPLPTNTASSSATSSKPSQAAVSSEPQSTSATRPTTVTTTSAPSRTSAVAASSSTTSSTTNGAASKATNAAGAMFAVGLALLAL